MTGKCANFSLPENINLTQIINDAKDPNSGVLKYYGVIRSPFFAPFSAFNRFDKNTEVEAEKATYYANQTFGQIEFIQT